MHWHWQNLNDQPGGTQGWALRHGRAWFHFGDHCFHVEWSMGRWCCGAMLNFERDRQGTEGVTLSVQVPLLFTLYIAPPIPKRVQAWIGRKIGDSYSSGRDFGIRVFDWGIWWSCAEHTMESGPRDQWWRRGVWRPIDTLLGRHKFSSRVVKEETVLIPMPEKTYTAKATTKLMIWKRPRWFPMHRLSTTLDIDGGIPVPGKGENSWDCGDDGIYGISGATVEDAIANAVKSALKDRTRYGGKQWQSVGGFKP